MGSRLRVAQLGRACDEDDIDAVSFDEIPYFLGVRVDRKCERFRC